MADGVDFSVPAGSARGRIMPWVEHVLKGLSMAGAVAIAVIGIYFTIIRHLDEHDTKLQLHDQRFMADEQTISRLDEAQRLISTETRQKLDQLLAQIGDLRVLVAGQGQGQHAPR